MVPFLPLGPGESLEVRFLPSLEMVVPPKNDTLGIEVKTSEPQKNIKARKSAEYSTPPVLFVFLLSCFG